MSLTLFLNKFFFKDPNSEFHFIFHVLLPFFVKAEKPVIQANMPDERSLKNLDSKITQDNLDTYVLESKCR